MWELHHAGHFKQICNSNKKQIVWLECYRFQVPVQALIVVYYIRTLHLKDYVTSIKKKNKKNIIAYLLNRTLKIIPNSQSRWNSVASLCGSDYPADDWFYMLITFRDYYSICLGSSDIKPLLLHHRVPLWAESELPAHKVNGPASFLLFGEQGRGGGEVQDRFLLWFLLKKKNNVL